MIIGKNILLRALEPTDVDLLYSWENNQEIWEVSNTLTPYSKFVLEQYIANSHLDIYTNKQLRLMICGFEKNTIGCIDLFDFDAFHQRAGIGILIANKENRNKGYASEALSLLIEYCFNTLNLNQVYCNIAEDNLESIRLFEKQQFTISGIKKEWIKQGKEYKNEYLLQRINK